jgi:hypothetical protein
MKSSQPQDGQPFKQLPPDIYISIVDSLYADGRSLFIGAATVGLAMLLAAWKTANWAYVLFAGGLVLLSVLRAIDFGNFHRRRKDLKTVEQFHVWESHYLFGSAAQVVLLGGWCLFAFTVVPSDGFVRLLSFSVTLGYLVGIAGRNFGSNRLVTTQSASAAIPMIGALWLQHDLHHIVFGILLIPFFWHQVYFGSLLGRWSAS